MQASAKVERGQVKLQHCYNTLLYYTVSCNPNSGRPLELVYNMLLPNFAMGFDASNETTSTFTPPLVAKPLGDSATVVGTSLDACHGGHAGFIVISSTSEDGGAQTTNDLEEVSVPDFDEESNEGVESLAPKKQKKNYDLTCKFQLEWACKLPWAEGILTNNDRLHVVKCTMWSTMEKTERLMQPKWDTIKKHEGRSKAIRNMPAYNVKKIKNKKWYMAALVRQLLLD